MTLRCQLCGAPCSEAQTHCSRQCGQAAREGAKDGIEARLRRSFQRKRRPPGPAPDPESEQMFFEVEGMWTAGCAGAVEEVLKSVGGAADAQVVGETGRGRAFYDPDKASPRDLLRVLRRYGFRAVLVRDAWARAEGFSRTWEVALAVRLGVSTTLAVHVFYLSALLAFPWSGPVKEAPTLRVLMFFFTLPVVLYGGLPILTNAVWAVARRRVTADVLTAVGILGAFGISAWNLAWGGPLRFDAVCAIVVATLFARFCEYRARRRLALAGERLSALVSGNATRLRRGEEILCVASELRPGDVVLVNAGGRVPADGDVVDGTGVLEPITGGHTEASPGDRVAAGGKLASGRLVIRAERTGAGTSVGELARILENAMSTRMPGSLAASRGLIWIGIATLLGAMYAIASGGPDLSALAAVLLVTAPAAVALLPEIAAISAMGRAAAGLAGFRGGDALEAAARASSVVLDRSALVEPRAVADPCLIEGSPADFWAVVASLTAVASGPTASALRERARHEGAPSPAGVPASEGRLSRATIEGRDAAIGDRASLEGLGWKRPAAAERALAEEDRGRSLVWVGWDGAIRGAIAIDSADRPGVENIGRELRHAGLLTCLAGADADAALDAQATRLKLDTWLSAASLPENIAKRRASGRATALAARSTEEAPAGVAEADVAIAVDCAQEGSPEWAGVLALGGDAAAIPAAMGSARRAAVARRRGGALAFLFHVAAIPVAAAGVLDPLTAAGMGIACGLGMITLAFRAGGRPR